MTTASTLQDYPLPLHWAGYPKTLDIGFMAKVTQATTAAARGVGGGQRGGHGG